MEKAQKIKDKCNFYLARKINVDVKLLNGERDYIQQNIFQKYL
jgi:hypothetical protein